MFEILKTVITAGGYKLTEIRQKIKKLYVIGDLTEAQMDELLLLASVGISTDAERPEMLVLLQTLAEKLEALENRVKALEVPVEGGGSNDDEYEDWEPWDGISNKYQQGAVVKYNGKLWVSQYAGQNVWSPSVYPDGWSEVVAEDAEGNESEVSA